MRPSTSLTAAMVAAIVAAMTTAAIAADQPGAIQQSVLGRMPIREVTVFKDGHALVVHEEALPTDEAGDVQLDHLPAPVLGTFWPYSADPAARLTSVVAAPRVVTLERTALDVRSLLEANVGAQVIVRDYDGTDLHGRIVDVPKRDTRELAATSPPGAADQLPQPGGMILLETADGVRAMPLERIGELTFREPPRRTVATAEFRNLLTLRLAWPEGRPAETARVGMAYLQRGIRWIPSYRVELDGDGTARVRLSATLINELADLDDVTAHLVIGVPTFAFKDTVDPIALQQAVAQLSPYFQEGSDTSYMLSNAIMTQTARMGEYRGEPQPPAGGDLGPAVAESGESEDLFVFRVEHVTLRKGERMVLPVAEFELSYRDVYTLDLPLAPPLEARQQFGTQQQAELAALFSAPKAVHKLRLHNASDYPLTTAPALIVRDGRVLAQGMMTYTSRGATTDLAVTAAVNVQVEHSDLETGRHPRALEWNGQWLARIDLQGTIRLTNHMDRPVDVEITREVPGAMDAADHDGRIEKLNLHDGPGQAAGGLPYWWPWYAWPHWWYQYNGIGRARWVLTLPAGETVELRYTWHYFWL